MIFVTVGTTMPFDELCAEADRLAAAGLFGDEELVCQSGQSTYVMQHGTQFRGRPGLDDLIAQASLVLSHGGATVIQLLMAQKPFVAFPNPRGAGDHQTSFLAQVAEVADISWGRTVAEAEALIRERRRLGPARLRGGLPRVAEVVREMVGVRA